jgi:hypothetical protein
MRRCVEQGRGARDDHVTCEISCNGTQVTASLKLVRRSTNNRCTGLHLCRIDVSHDVCEQNERSRGMHNFLQRAPGQVVVKSILTSPV